MSDRPLGIRQRNVTLIALLAMAAGFSLGLVAKASGIPWLLQLREIAAPVGTLWTNGLRMTVIPLMVAYIVLAINSVNSARNAGKLGGIAMISFLIMLAAAAALTLTLGAWLFSMMPVDESVRSTFRSLAAGADVPVVPAAASSPGVSDWFSTIIPSNPFRAAVDDNFLGVVICTLIFALAILKIDPERRRTLIRFFEAAAETTSVVVGWIIFLLPIAAFALSFVIAVDIGLSFAASVAWFVVTLSGLLLLMTILLYPATAMIAGVSMRRFFRASAPALAVGAGTRSSIAALPAMLDGAENELGVRREVSGFILPLAVSTFKLNPAISMTADLLFFIALFELNPSPAVILGFVITKLLIAFASAGIPSGSKLISWPFFMAMGVPIEALVVLKVVDVIPDIFKTMLNVTADMSVTVIVQRFSRQPAPEAVGTPEFA